MGFLACLHNKLEFSFIALAPLLGTAQAKGDIVEDSSIEQKRVLLAQAALVPPPIHVNLFDIRFPQADSAGGWEPLNFNLCIGHLIFRLLGFGLLLFGLLILSLLIFSFIILGLLILYRNII